MMKWKQWEGIDIEEGGRTWCIKLLVHKPMVDTKEFLVFNLMILGRNI
jgi:hypothetical protein